MLQLTSQITFNNKIVFNFVTEVEIHSSWENLTDKCKIVVPKKLSFNGKPIVIGLTETQETLFKRGQSVEVKLGYDGNLVTVFTGYISKINPRLPLVFECEDEMYLLKKKTLSNMSFSSLTLSTLLKSIIPSNVKYVATMDQNLGKFRIRNNATVAQVLDHLKSNYRIYSFFRNGVLYVGLPYVVNLRQNKVTGIQEVLNKNELKQHTFYLEKNVIENNLEYMRKDDLDIKVHVVGIGEDNKRNEYYYPSKDTPGQEIDIHINNTSEDAMKQIAITEYNKVRYEGWRGEFITFGAPFVNHGDGVQFKSTAIPEYNNGVYLVKSVHRTFGLDGYRQRIQLANRIQV
jgi:hypothetical protein